MWTRGENIIEGNKTRPTLPRPLFLSRRGGNNNSAITLATATMAVYIYARVQPLYGEGSPLTSCKRFSGQIDVDSTNDLPSASNDLRAPSSSSGCGGTYHAVQAYPASPLSVAREEIWTAKGGGKTNRPTDSHVVVCIASSVHLAAHGRGIARLMCNYLYTDKGYPTANRARIKNCCTKVLVCAPCCLWFRSIHAC